MTRPTILDLDIVVVPREPVREMWAASGDAIAQVSHVHHDRISELSYTAMLSASPYLTAWDDVRKAYDALERERDAAIGSAERQWAGWVKSEAESKRRIAELEKRLADAEMVIEPFAEAADSFEGNERENSDIWENSAAMAITFGHLRAARAYMEGK